MHRENLTPICSRWLCCNYVAAIFLLSSLFDTVDQCYKVIGQKRLPSDLSQRYYRDLYNFQSMLKKEVLSPCIKRIKALKISTYLEANKFTAL